jgi:ribosomal protein S18 acetylase RimI-like enzyme
MLQVMRRAVFAIREGGAADWAALGQAVAEIQDFEREIVGYPLRPGREIRQAYLADLRERMSVDDGVFLVAEAGGEVVGVLAGYVHQAGDRLVETAFDRSAYISDLLVRSAWRRQGVGAALVRAFADAMRAKGLQWMSVCVKSGNAVAHRAYRTYGFEDYETVLTKRL